MPNILIAVVGTSPAVVTETLQALADKNVAIDEMHIVTTSIGKEKLFDALRSKGRFSQLRREYPGDDEHAKIADSLLDMDQEHCCIPRYRLDRKELADITSEEDATLMADHICELVRLKTDAPENRVFASIAGGRKTMSFWLGCAMSLFGRPGDKLLHVLVNEPFESCDEFFYKPKGPTKVRVTDDVSSKKYKKHDMVSTDIADIALGEIPFPQLRPLLKKTHWLDLETEIDVGKIMSEINLAAAGPSLVFHDEEKTIDFGEGRSLKLSSTPYYSVYKLCAEVAAGEGVPPSAPAKSAKVMTIDDFVLGNRWATDRLISILDRDDGKLAKGLSKIRRWNSLDGLLWDEARSRRQQFIAARRELKALPRRLAQAEKSLTSAQAKRDAARGVFAQADKDKEKASETVGDARRMLKSEAAKRKCEDNEKNAAAKLERAKRNLLAARQLVSDAEATNKSLNASYESTKSRFSELEKRMLVDARDAAVTKRKREVAAIISALRQARIRVNEDIEREFDDPGLRALLKLMQGKKSFTIGLSEELRDASRIQFLP
jgi:CRISPR-associated protein (TIGR02584 family)